jgi:DNA polymerase delta subunit 3
VTSKDKHIEKQKADVKGKAKEIEPVKKEKPIEKPKATGKLDWSRAKTKEIKREETKEDVKMKSAPSSKNDRPSGNKPLKEEPKVRTSLKFKGNVLLMIAYIL